MRFPARSRSHGTPIKRAQKAVWKTIKHGHLPMLAAAMRKARREVRLTQSELASAANFCRNALVAIEAGRGYIGTMVALADALNLEISGRGLVSAGSLGQRLLALRKRRKLSRRMAATMASISIPAIEGIERRGSGHVASLEALGRAIGAGLCLVPKGTSPDFWTSAATSTGESEWYTPAWLLELVVSVVGPFDTDPCSPGRGKSAVHAKLHFTAEDDGLAHEWRGTTWCNPPYGRSISLWLDKARHEVEVGHARCVVALVPARTDTAWWHDHVAGVADIILLRGRIAFGDGTCAAPFPSAVLGYGLTLDQREGLFAAFPGSMRVAAPTAVEGKREMGPKHVAEVKPTSAGET